MDSTTLHTIQIDRQVFDVLQRAAAWLVEPSPNAVLRRMLLADPVLSRLPAAPWPSPFEALDAAPPAEASPVVVSAFETPASKTPAVEARASTPPAFGTVPPPRMERPAAVGRVPAWVPLSEVVTPPPGLQQVFDVLRLVVRHRVPRAEALRRVSDLRRASGAPTGGPRLQVGARDFDRMVRQRGHADLRKWLKATFPNQRRAIDAFLDDLSASGRRA